MRRWHLSYILLFYKKKNLVPFLLPNLPLSCFHIKENFTWANPCVSTFFSNQTIKSLLTETNDYESRLQWPNDLNFT